MVSAAGLRQDGSGGGPRFNRIAGATHPTRVRDPGRMERRGNGGRQRQAEARKSRSPMIDRWYWYGR